MKRTNKRLTHPPAGRFGTFIRDQIRQRSKYPEDVFTIGKLLNLAGISDTDPNYRSLAVMISRYVNGIQQHPSPTSSVVKVVQSAFNLTDAEIRNLL